MALRRLRPEGHHHGSRTESASMPVIAVIAPGAMGARLVEHGAEVWTVLAGRSPASGARAEAAGMLGVDARQIGAADVVLSIVPPGGTVARLGVETFSGAERHGLW